jgi:hypothetical protein
MNKEREKEQTNNRWYYGYISQHNPNEPQTKLVINIYCNVEYNPLSVIKIFFFL